MIPQRIFRNEYLRESMIRRLIPMVSEMPPKADNKIITERNESKEILGLTLTCEE